MTLTSMPRVGFEPKIPVFERGKMVHVLDHFIDHRVPNSSLRDSNILILVFITDFYSEKFIHFNLQLYVYVIYL
jgi:hypothetical protein